VVRLARVVCGLWAFALGAMVACGAFGTSDDAAPGSDASADRSADDVAVTPDAGGSVDDASPNLLINGDFEPDLGCGGWHGENGQASFDPHGRNDSGACLVCSMGDSGPYAIYQDTKAIYPPGTQLAAHAYLLAPPDGSTATNLSATVTSNPSGESGEPAPSLPLSGEWTRIDTLVVSHEGGTSFVFEVRSESSPSCFLIDDAYVGILR
jgi:hypothetical protein